MAESTKFLVSSVLRNLLLLTLFSEIVALTVDNQLVSARNDCFERIALEAMLPIEKTFRTEDTNSLKMCKDKCIQAGEKCQSISFGVHRRGNGTCQLSIEKFGMSGGRPSGIIFDPDFDLYARKTNCFDLSDNTIPMQDSMSGDGGGGAYGGLSPTPSLQIPNRVGGDPAILVVNPSPPTTSTTYDTRSPPPTDGYISTTQYYPEGPASTLGTSTTHGDRLFFSHDIYPLYKYPMLYEHNYPAPNEDVYIPGGYASNAPEVEDRYRPSQSMDNGARPLPNGPPRPIFGLGYGNGYSYGKPEHYNPTTLRPYETIGPVFSPLPDRRPPVDRDQPNFTLVPGTYPNHRPDGPDRPMGPYSPQKRPDHDQSTSTYYPRPEYGASTPMRPSLEARPTTAATSNNRPGDFIDYTNRPDPPSPAYASGSPTRPPVRDRDPGPAYQNDQNRYNYVRRNGTAAQQDGNSNNDDKTIATYFNPDEYSTGSNKKRPVGYGNRDRLGFPMDAMKACFRRVLAGKRIAPHWVRRTIACERVEECMRECGNEKRFPCEGFNYRLDPSGHGQGDCELIEVPLAEMDLYSSTHRRDSNLLRHPDYDYYERDRNAPSSCRRNICKDCSKGPLSSPPLYFKPSGWADKPSHVEHYISSPPSGSGYGGDASRYPHPSDTTVDRYRPAVPQLPPVSYDHRKPLSPPSASDYYHSSHEFSSHGSTYFEHTPPSSYGGSSSGSGPIDRYDYIRPNEHRYRPSRPDRWESIPSSSGYDSGLRPDLEPVDRFRPPYRPGPDYSPYRHSSHSDDIDSTGPSGTYHSGPQAPRPSHNYLDRGQQPPSGYKKPGKFVPYSVGETNWSSYGGNYGSSYSKQSSYWGLNENRRRKDPLDFNYFELGGSRRDPPREANSVLNYASSGYGGYGADRDRHDYRYQWTRRPGPDECSAKTSEGFRLHKTVVKHSFSVPTLTECERLCSGQDGFICHTYSYRYNQIGRDNCMLCDRPVNNLDYYVDIEPDRDYDIYSMADDMDVCKKPSRSDGPSTTTALSDPRNAQCFFRAIDGTRFFKSIVRDSLTVRSVGECELECIKSSKFTCRAFAFRYEKQRQKGIIDNCQLSDWPVRDMDKERHLILDTTFDVFERASYGHGCEIQPIVDDKHKKFCYLGYGSPAKLLSAAIKKVISVPSELACKKECIRFRETTSFKCYSFSFGTRATSFNCEMSDLDQTELKINVHYTHTNERDYWLFAWNPFDWTCRDKVNTIGGTRVNNDRRMDIFREPGDVAWRHYTVSGKACRLSSPCEKNIVTGFYSCEIDEGEIGSWDYCCKADHPCGYSQGFDYPWCFVGDELDQWRKCSDRYFPGNRTQTHSNIHLTTSKLDNKKHGSISSVHSSSSSNEYQQPPRPGGLQSLTDFTAARLWPVTYLYSEGPPNSTEFSNFVDCNKENC